MRSLEKIDILPTQTQKMASVENWFQKYKQLEQKLRESEERFDIFYNALLSGVIIHDQGVIQECTSRVSEITGFTYDELIGMDALNLIAEESRELVRHHIEDGYSDEYETKCLCRNGSVCPVSIRGRKVFHLGRQLRVVEVRDITKRRRLEADRDRLLQAIEQSSETIVITDPAGTIQYVNPAFETITGYTKDEALGLNPCILKGGDQDDDFYQTLWATLTSGKRWKGRFRNKKKDGSFYIEDATISPVINSSGQITNYIAVKRDITHEAEMESQLLQKHKMEAVGLMAGGMSHNFNNSLAIILGNLEMAQRKIATPEKAKEYIENAKIAAVRSQELVQKIQKYGRGKKTDKESVSLSSVIKETINLVRSTAPSTVDIKLISNCDTVLTINLSQLQELLINLCNNSIQAMSEKGILTILSEEVVLVKGDLPPRSDCSPGRYAKISVQDTGCGMSSEIRKRIFEPFFTTKDVGKGTGMGLATVQWIVDQHDGLIKVMSTLGEGTIFDLYFPIGGKSQENTDKDSFKSSFIPSGTEKILFVDDEEMLTDVWSRILRTYGYQVTAMTSSTEALRLFKENPEFFDLVISDQTMPVLCGKEFLKEILSIKPDSPTILCTGYTTKITKKEAEQIGIKEFLKKPFDLPVLLQIVRQVLDKEDSEDSL